MTSEIPESFEPLTGQGPKSVSTYLAEAVRRTNQEFGEGCAENQPFLTGMFILAAAIDSSVAIVTQQMPSALSEIASAINKAIRPITHELRSLAGETESIANALQRS